MTVIDEIAAERRRQIEEEGWTPAHDDGHVRGQLARAAACYASHAVFGVAKGNKLSYQAPYARPGWPWHPDWWKPKDPRQDLVRAAALIVAEIERLDRAAAAVPASGTP